jgi:N-formylglutamate amidohydrolase
MSAEPAPASASRFVAGNMPVVLVAGHGGDARPEAIPDNEQGGGPSHVLSTSQDYPATSVSGLSRDASFDCLTSPQPSALRDPAAGSSATPWPLEGRSPDVFTDILADDIAAQLRRLGKSPYMAVARISRTKVDLNDPPGQAYVNVPGGAGQAIYDNFHKTLWEFGEAAIASYGWVLIVDLHGFRPRPTLPGEPSDLVLGTVHGQTMPLAGQGAVSRAGFSGFLAQQGWKVKPAQVEPEIVFSGGYIVSHHGKPAVNRYAVQVEIASAVRRNPVQRLKLAGDLARYFDVITILR